MRNNNIGGINYIRGGELFEGFVYRNIHFYGVFIFGVSIGTGMSHGAMYS